MAQFQVPQFIEIEDKIVGPLTLRQFIYIGIAGIFSFFLFFLLKTWIWVVFSSSLFTIAGILAFIKINGQPMYVILIYALKYFWRPRFYLWQKPKIESAKSEIKISKIELVAPEIAKEKTEETKKPLLKNLWLKIQTGGQMLRPNSITTIFQKLRKNETEMQQKSRRIDYR